MKEVPLTQEKVALVDDDDFEWVTQWKWHATYNNRSKPGEVPKWYAARKQRVGKGKYRRVTVYLHREIARRADGPIPAGLVVDHFPNPDGLDCRRSNLRVVTQAENTDHCRFKKHPSPPDPYL